MRSLKSEVLRFRMLEAGNQALALYNERRVSRIEWELIEELDPNNKQILTVLYKLPTEQETV